MRIAATRRGGIRGLPEQQIGPVDTASLDSAAAAEVERAVNDAGFFDLPPSLPGQGHDVFYYSLDVTDAERHHSVEWNDASSGAEGPGRILAALRQAGHTFDE